MSTLAERICVAAEAGRNDELVELLKDASETDLCYEHDTGIFFKRTPLMIAAANGQTESAAILVKANADINRQESTFGYTALTCAAWKGHTSAVQALIELGADLNIQDKEGYSGLMLAASANRAATVEALLAAGADRTLLNKEGKTAADLAENEDIRALINVAP